jgi:hypothetical protein
VTATAPVTATALTAPAPPSAAPLIPGGFNAMTPAQLAQWQQWVAGEIAQRAQTQNAPGATVPAVAMAPSLSTATQQPQVNFASPMNVAHPQPQQQLPQPPSAHIMASPATAPSFYPYAFAPPPPPPVQQLHISPAVGTTTPTTTLTPPSAKSNASQLNLALVDPTAHTQILTPPSAPATAPSARTSPLFMSATKSHQRDSLRRSSVDTAFSNDATPPATPPPAKQAPQTQQQQGQAEPPAEVAMSALPTTPELQKQLELSPQ